MKELGQFRKFNGTARLLEMLPIPTSWLCLAALREAVETRYELAGINRQVYSNFLHRAMP